MLLAIDTRARGSAMAVCALVATLALADAETKGSPTDLEWLRDEVADGALIHHSDGRIYLTELATADSVLVGNGNQPEFSPDGTKFAWIDGRALSIEAIRPGGLARKVHWRYAGGFDNHRWASHNPDYMVVIDEADEKSKGVTYPVVMRADGSRGARLGNKGLGRHMVYGDFAVGDGVGEGWLAP